MALCSACENKAQLQLWPTSHPSPLSLPSPIPDGCLHDLTTYSGRVQHFFDMVDLRNALLSKEDISSAQKLLADFKSKQLPAGVSDAQLWDAKKSERA